MKILKTHRDIDNAEVVLEGSTTGRSSISIFSLFIRLKIEVNLTQAIVKDQVLIEYNEN